MATIIFDFDGTIADSFDFVAGFLAEGIKTESLSEPQKQELRGLSMAAMARKLGYSWGRLPLLFLQGRRRMQGAIKQLEPFDDMVPVIQQLHADGHRLFVVSSNSRRNVRGFLSQHDLQGCFLEIVGNVGLFGKAGALRRLLKRHHLQPTEAMYIGDELRDVQAAQSINLPVIAVTWGFAQPADLSALQPTALTDSPNDLINIINGL
jgi:phosphoglycolate phosphatase